MKLKKISLFDIDLGKVIEFAEKGISELWLRSEKQLEAWLDNKPKSKRQSYLDKKEKERKEQLKIIAEEHDGFLEMQDEPNVKNVNERFAELETQTNEKENDHEASHDADVER